MRLCKVCSVVDVAVSVMAGWDSEWIVWLKEHWCGLTSLQLSMNASSRPQGVNQHVFSNKHVANSSITEFFTQIRVKKNQNQNGHKSDQQQPKMILLYSISAVAVLLPLGALRAFSLPLLSPSSSFPASFVFISACRHPTWGGLCFSGRDAAANSGICCCALSLLSRRAQRLQGLSPSWYWNLCSHELWLLHRLLMCGWIPWGVAGDIGSGCAHWSLHAGRRAPDRCHRGRTARKSTASG